MVNDIFLKTSQICRDLIWVTLMVSEVLPEFSSIVLVNVLPSIVRSYETFLYYSFFVIFAVGTSGCLLASFLEDDGLVTVGTNKIPKYERSVDDQFSPSPRSVVSGSLPALFPLKRQLVVLG